MDVSRELLGVEVRIAINSHWHRDHTYGNHVLSSRANIISTVRTRQLMAEKLPALLIEQRQFAVNAVEELSAAVENASTDEERQQKSEELARWSGIKEGLASVVLHLPDITFTDKLTLHGTNRRVELLTFGGGHTESDTVLFLPDDGIVFAADLLFNGMQPWIGSGNAAEMAQSLEQIKRLGPEVWVPGHGDVTDASCADLMIRYARWVQKAIDDSRTVDEAAAVPLPPEFEALEGVELFERNVRALYKKRT
jgi:glyoxylase-like metal-dependent hydrolase (beta-lactamase superfamily II)